MTFTEENGVQTVFKQLLKYYIYNYSCTLDQI